MESYFLFIVLMYDNVLHRNYFVFFNLALSAWLTTGHELLSWYKRVTSSVCSLLHQSDVQSTKE